MLQRPQLKLQDEHQEEQIEWDILEIPPQLAQSNIDSFVSWGSKHQYLVVDDAASRKKMNQYKSIAERLATRILANPQGGQERRKRRMEKYMVEKQSIESLLQKDEFSDVKDILQDDILRNWDIQEFVSFFVANVTSVVSERQFNGIHRNWNKRRNRMNCDTIEPNVSIKQQYRSTKKRNPMD